jgi:iron complex outermembrane receptor protein
MEFKTSLRLKRVLMLSTVAVGLSSPVLAQTAAKAAPAAGQGVQLEEVVVTARRREERLQDVPAAVTAFSPAKLQEAQVTTARQLVGMVPSLNVNSGNQRDFQRFAIRGQGATTGGGESVTAYFAEAPLSQFIAGGPGMYFDLQNVQVLNGPQGTLFGRNTVGGAVLFTPKRPTNNFGGFIQAGYGNYNNEEIAGALNVAPVPDKLRFRFSADLRKRDGFTHQFSDGSQLDNINYQSYRASMLFNPTDRIENYTVAQYTRSDTGGTGIVITAVNPLTPAAIAGTLNTALAKQASLGIRTTQGTGPHWWDTASYAVVNNTTVKLTSDLTFKNVFSYSRQKISGGFDNDGTSFPLTQWVRTADSGQASSPGESRNEYITEEVQLQGQQLGGKLNWVAGGFWQNSYPYAFQTIILNAGGTIQPTESYLGTTSHAYFGQATFDFGALSESLSGLKLTAGYRYSWDTRHYVVASWKQTGTDSTLWACNNVTGNYVASNPAGAFCQKAYHGAWEAPTYNLTLDYKINPHFLVYAAHRTGYKSGGFNTVANVLVPTTYNPEKVADYELGAKTDFTIADRPVRVNLDIFQDNYSPIQRSVFAPTPGSAGASLTYLSSVASARIRGLEAEISFKPVDPVTVDVTYSYLDAYYTSYPFFRDQSVPTGSCPLNTATPPAHDPSLSPCTVDLTGSPLPFAPRHKVGINVKWDTQIDPQWGKLTLNANYNYQSHFIDTDQVQPSVYRIGDYGLLGLNATWANIRQSNIDLEAYVTNATDTKAIAAGQVFYYSAFAAAASYIEPRMFGMRLRYHFGAE